MVIILKKKKKTIENLNTQTHSPNMSQPYNKWMVSMGSKIGSRFLAFKLNHYWLMDGCRCLSPVEPDSPIYCPPHLLSLKPSLPHATGAGLAQLFWGASSKILN